MLDTLPLLTSLLSPTCSKQKERTHFDIMSKPQHPVLVFFLPVCHIWFVTPTSDWFDLSLFGRKFGMNVNVLWEFICTDVHFLKSIRGQTWPESTIHGVLTLVHSLHWHAVLYNDCLLPIAIMLCTPNPNSTHGSCILNDRHSIPE